MIVIETAKNGWIMRDKSDSEMEKLFVFSEGDSDKESVEAFRYLLWSLNELCGPTTSRYSAHRINITIEPGDNHQGGEDESLQQHDSSNS